MNLQIRKYRNSHKVNNYIWLQYYLQVTSAISDCIDLGISLLLNILRMSFQTMKSGENCRWPF